VFLRIKKAFVPMYVCFLTYYLLLSTAYFHVKSDQDSDPVPHRSALHSWIRVWICIEIKRWIRIRAKPMRIHNTDFISDPQEIFMDPKHCFLFNEAFHLNEVPYPLGTVPELFLLR
jgi:hypothetical protein